jgi:Domain of unknown function (DUF4383)
MAREGNGQSERRPSPNSGERRRHTYLSARNYARIFGVVFVLVGLVGFALTGAVYLVGARASEAGARTVVTVLSATYLLVGIIGLLAIGTSANIVALNAADNLLHIGTGLLGLAVVAFSPRRVAAPTA